MFEVNPLPRIRPFNTEDPNAGAYAHTFACHDPLHNLGGMWVIAVKETGANLQEGCRGAEPVHCLGELHTDGTAPDHA